jgi:2-keto-3-deoxy-L-rhamnonate aldolase RhmA
LKESAEMNLELGKILRTKLSQGTPVLGSWLSLGSSTAAEIMAEAGYDFLVVDLEHSPTSVESAAEMIRVIDLAGCSPLVRLPEFSPSIIKQVLDAGAHGIVIPNVDSAHLAEAAVRATRYPPDGTRGVGLHRAQGYGHEFLEYFESAQRNLVVVVQIESNSAVQNIEKIVAVDGIDAVMIGPYDLSADLGVPGEFDSERFVQSVKKVTQAARNAKIATGIHVVEPDPTVIESSLEDGHSFLVYSVDMRILDVGARIGGDILRGRE